MKFLKSESIQNSNGYLSQRTQIWVCKQGEILLLSQPLTTSGKKPNLS